MGKTEVEKVKNSTKTKKEKNLITTKVSTSKGFAQQSEKVVGNLQKHKNKCFKYRNGLFCTLLQVIYKIYAHYGQIVINCPSINAKLKLPLIHFFLPFWF